MYLTCSKALKCILLEQVKSLGSHKQRVGNAYLGCIKAYLGPCQTSMIDTILKIGHGLLQVNPISRFSREVVDFARIL